MASQRELAPDDPSFDISDEGVMAALFSAEDRHFWHRARNRFILGRLRGLSLASGARIVDLGCGAGCVARELSLAGYDLTGVDGHRALIDLASKRAPMASFLCRDLRLGVPDLGAGTFDAACLFDVLEHLDEPEHALQMALDLVRSGGYVVGTVPALMSLWSGVDEHAGHKIRYTHSTLRQVLSGRTGAHIVEIASFFRSLVPIMWAQRRLIGARAGRSSAVKNLTVPPRPVNGALLALVTLEHLAAPMFDKLGVPGASLWFALEKI